MKTETQTLELAVDSHAGVYAWQEFVKQYGHELINLDPEDEAILLAGPDHEFYWEAAQTVEDNCSIRDRDGIEWAIFQNEDIWFVHPAHVWED